MQRVSESARAPPSLPGAEPAYDFVPVGAAAKLMSDHVSTIEPKPAQRRRCLDAHGQARDLIRLVQCAVCSRPFTSPVSLPCGHTTCKRCLPEPSQRLHITYPNTPDRQHGITCPAPGCEQEFPVAECNIDVILAEVMDVIRLEVTKAGNEAVDSCIIGVRSRPADSEKQGLRPDAENGGGGISSSSRKFTGGRLLATFLLAELGELLYDDECGYEAPSAEQGGDHSARDRLLLQRIRERMQPELDCQVCYNTFLQPVTTPCGHTFCRKCLIRALDHANYCPMCRSALSIAPSLVGTSNNLRLEALLDNLCPEVMEAREEAMLQEEQRLDEMDTSIFVCTIAFPYVPTFLHIFEPRYRLMIRRALETNRRFGMVNYASPRPYEGLGRVAFTLYGTMVEITNYNLLPDGRSLIEATGLYPFKVKKVGNLDGYMIGQVERVHDISTIEEEDRERQELMAHSAPQVPTTPESILQIPSTHPTTPEPQTPHDSPSHIPSSPDWSVRQDHTHSIPSAQPPPSPSFISNPLPTPPLTQQPSIAPTATNPGQRRDSAQMEGVDIAANPPPTQPATPPALESMTTDDLFRAGLSFVNRMHAVSAPWLHSRIIAAYGDVPAEPKRFPYWFASVLPIADEEKYRLLHTDSVRERLKIVNGWIRHIEGQRLNNGGACSIL